MNCCDWCNKTSEQAQFDHGDVLYETVDDRWVCLDPECLAQYALETLGAKDTTAKREKEAEQ